MKKFALTISLLAICVYAALLPGCTNMPAGQRACLYTAQLAIEITAKDANTAKNFPWRAADPNETPADTINRLKFGQTLLIRTMDQANLNLIEVIRWSERSDEGLPAKEDSK